jgi:hypothetical protein
VKNSPRIIYITVLAADSANGLHPSLGFEARADHCKYIQYSNTIDDVRILASSLVLKMTIT